MGCSTLAWRIRVLGTWLLCALAAVTAGSCNTAALVQVSHSGAGAFEAALAPSGQGFAVAWHDQRDGNPEIYLRLLDGSGRPTGPEQRLTHTSGTSYEASIEPLGDGVVVAWYERNEAGQQTAWLGLWTADGTNRWMHALAESSRNPVVRATGDAIFCAWIETEDDGTESVRAAWWNADGRSTGAPIRLATASATTWNVNAVLDVFGTAWVVFDADTSTRSSELYLARVAAGGVDVVQLTADDGAPSKYPDLALSSEGRVALTWFDERDGNQEVYLFVSTAASLTGALDHRARRVTTTPGDSIGAYTTWNGDRVGLAWSDATEGQYEVYFQSFDAAGVPLSPQRQLTHTPAWSLVPAIQPLRAGFALAWNEYVPESGELHAGTSEVVFVTIP